MTSHLRLSIRPCPFSMVWSVESKVWLRKRPPICIVFDDPLSNIEGSIVKEYWYNINDNIVVLIEFEGQEYVIETDSGEIVSSGTWSCYNLA